MQRILVPALFLFLSLAPAAQAQVVSVTIAPPAPRVEVRPAPPSPRHVWMPGYWHWRGGRHVWMGGRYMVPPTAGLLRTVGSLGQLLKEDHQVQHNEPLKIIASSWIFC